MDNPPPTPGTSGRAKTPAPFWAAARHGLLAALFAGVALAILVSPLGRNAQPTYNLSIGDVALADISAPRSITYISTIQTTAQQQSALAAVAPIFDPPDGRIARTQLAAAQAALASITALRSDNSLQAPQKLTNLQLNSGANLDPDSAQTLLNLPEARWQAVATDTLRVLETTLRDPVRAAALDAARSAAADRTSMLLSTAEGRIAATLAAQWIVPNSLYNEPATKLARQAALDATQTVNQNFLAGQTVLRRGSIVRPEDLEALTQLGLLRGSTNWLTLLLPPTLVVLLVTVLFALYVRTQLPEYITNTRHLLFVIFFGAPVSAWRKSTGNSARAVAISVSRRSARIADFSGTAAAIGTFYQRPVRHVAQLGCGWPPGCDAVSPGGLNAGDTGCWPRRTRQCLLLVRCCPCSR